MKLSYFGYSVLHHDHDTNYLFDIRQFIQAFGALDDVSFKNKFTHADEQVYLVPFARDLYLFLITRKHEIIKRIKSQDLSVTEIYDLLSNDESLGFASYIYFDKNYLGFASTIMAPKSRTFSQFVNDLFEAIGLGAYSFVLQPLMKQYTKADALAMDFVGRSVVQVTKENSFFEELRDFFGGTAEEFADVDAFEVVIKPRRKQNIRPAVRHVVNTVDDAGLDKMLLRAREEIGDNLMDVYLAGKGQVADDLDKSKENTIREQIRQKAVKNSVLQEKVREHEANDEFEKTEPGAFAELHDANAWADRISNL